MQITLLAFFTGSMFQPSAFSYNQVLIGEAHIRNCRDVHTSINLNETKLISDLCLRETLTAILLSTYTQSPNSLLLYWARVLYCKLGK